MLELYEQYHLLFKSIIILAFAISLHWVLRRSIRMILSRLNDKGYQTTKINFIKNSLGFIIYGVAIVLIIQSIPELKSVGSSLLAGAGIFAAVIGFASREAFANIISGVFLVIYKPFQIDDIIEIENGQKGTVTDITFRHTIIKDFENRKIIIPNSKIGEATILNSSLDGDNIRKQINFTISYESSVDLAREIITQEIEKHPNCIDHRTQEELNGDENSPKVLVLMTAWETSAINMRAWVWANSNAEAFRLECDVLETIKKRFQEEGVSIPYPQMKIHQ